MDATSAPTDASTIIRDLKPDAIRERLAALDRERSALRVLLRAALAAERRTAKVTA